MRESMTRARAAYARAFCVVWVTLLVVLPLAVLAGAIVSIVHLANLFADAVKYEPDHDALWLLQGISWVAGFAFLSIAVLWCVGTVCDGCLVRARAAYQCCFCCYGSGDVVVHSVEDLLEWSKAQRKLRDEEAQPLQSNRYATPVGHGWSFFLNKTIAPSPRLFLHHLSGPVRLSKNAPMPDRAYGDHWYYAGTTMGELMRELKRVPSTESAEGHTLASAPSHATITLGGWVAARAHGTGGTLWQPTVKAGWLLDQKTGELVTQTYKEMKTFFGRAQRRPFDARQLVLIAVCVAPIPNRWVQLEVKKKTQKIEESMWWLTTPSQLRCIFTGKRGSNQTLKP